MIFILLTSQCAQCMFTIYELNILQHGHFVHCIFTMSPKYVNFTVCSLYVHNIFTHRLQYGHYISIYPMYVRYVFIICNFIVCSPLFSVHSLAIYNISQLYIHYMFTTCSQNVSFTVCSLHVYNIFNHCLQHGH